MRITSNRRSSPAQDDFAVQRGAPKTRHATTKAAETSGFEPALTAAPTGYTIRSGDTLGAIARAYGFSLDELIEANPELVDPDQIVPGQFIHFPGAPLGRDDDGFEGPAPSAPVVLEPPAVDSDASVEEPAGPEEIESPAVTGTRVPEPYGQWMPYVLEASRKYDVAPELILAVISRETNGRNIYGDEGHGRGLMQIDDRWHTEWLENHEEGLDPASNIDYGTSIIRQNLDYFDGNLQAAMAAYNAGAGAVGDALDRGDDPDSVTTGGDYGSDVLARAEEFRPYV